MSCSTSANYIAKVICRSTGAISELAGKRSYYSAVALGGVSGGVLGVGLLAAQYMSRRRAMKHPGPTALTPLARQPQSLPRLSARTQIKPTTNIRSTDRCASCQATGQAKSGGGWYTINGRTYCQDCAPGTAREANIDLASSPPPPPTTATFTTTSTNSEEYLSLKKRIRTKAVPSEIKVQMGQDAAQKPVYYQVNGFQLNRTSGKDTGLALTPALRTETRPNGDVVVSEDRSRWYLVYARSGARLGPQPYADIAEAQNIAEILAQINWNRPQEQVPQVEQKRALASILLYNGLLSSAQQGVSEQVATSEQVPTIPPPITDAAPPTQANIPPTPSVAVDAPRPGLASFPAKNVSRELTGKLIADPLGGISRVLADEGEVLFVVDAFGKRYEVYRDQVWTPGYEDFNTVGVAQPINTAKTVTKHCKKCQTNSDNTPVGQAWYRMDWKTFCPNCAPDYADKEGWDMDIDGIDSEVKG